MVRGYVHTTLDAFPSHRYAIHLTRILLLFAGLSQAPILLWHLENLGRCRFREASLQLTCQPVGRDACCFEPASVTMQSSVIESIIEQQYGPQHGLGGQSVGEAEPKVLAFAALVAQLLCSELAESLPASITCTISQYLQQVVGQSAAESTAAGRAFSVTDALLQLLPQLAQLAAAAAGSAQQAPVTTAAAAAVPSVQHSTAGLSDQSTIVEVNSPMQHPASLNAHSHWMQQHPVVPQQQQDWDASTMCSQTGSTCVD
jgi:hypothetical protein